MTKLTEMNLPKARERKMHYCETCKEWVPEERKHNRKRHGK